jgi:hypothetical protein
MMVFLAGDDATKDDILLVSWVQQFLHLLCGRLFSYFRKIVDFLRQRRTKSYLVTPNGPSDTLTLV